MNFCRLSDINKIWAESEPNEVVKRAVAHTSDLGEEQNEYVNGHYDDKWT